MSDQSSRSREFLLGARDTLPMIVGAIPFGVLFGALAATAGMPFWAAMAMSLFVFAGSSQFVAATLVSQGVGTAVIVLTTFIVNLRHALYPWYYFGSAVFMYCNWQLCTVIGFVAGSSLDGLSEWGLEFAMVVTFIGIVVPLIVRAPMLIAAVVAIAVSLIARDLPHNMGLVIASVVGVVAGYIAEVFLGYDEVSA